MQPFGTKKLRNLSEQKYCATSWDKKSKQPLKTKKIKQPLETKNHVTSWDKKKSCNLLGQKELRNLSRQKNHATSKGEKILQPFRTK